MSAPLVSICVPTCEGGRYLTPCFQSILQQTLSDFEVVVVDDASTDQSYEIALDFARRDPRFRVYRNRQRLGLAENWNYSLRLSRGNWIKLLFQDDLIKPNCLEQLVRSCEIHGRTFSFCERELLYEKDVADETKHSFAQHAVVLNAIYGQDLSLDAATFAERYASRVGWNPVGEPTVTLFHRDLIQTYGGFEPNLVQLCDAEYWVRLGTNTGIVRVPDRLASFRVHQASTTSRNLSQRNFRMQRLDPLLFNYLILRKPYYRRLRKWLYRKDGRVRTWRNFMERVYQTFRDPGCDPSDAKNLLECYPGLRLIKLAHVL